jgi:hypothetical protein
MHLFRGWRHVHCTQFGAEALNKAEHICLASEEESFAFLSAGAECIALLTPCFISTQQTRAGEPSDTGYVERVNVNLKFRMCPRTDE